MKKLKFLLVTILILFIVESYAQISGCTDPKANNFNPVATQNDGLCTYNVTIYNPPVKYLLPDEINESSGLAYVNGKLWTINDSGGLPVLYAFDTLTGNIIQRITVANAVNNDWEALADDDQYIYIGDFGNNSGNRDDLTIYRVLKSDIPLSGNKTVQSSKLKFSYSDYPGKIQDRKYNNFDCEAFIAFNDSLYLFSKNYGDQKTKLYSLPKVPGNYTARLVSEFNTYGLITGADISENGEEITLIGYVNKQWIPFIWLLFDFDDNKFFEGNKRRLDLLNITATQTEAIVYTTGRNEVITSEGRILFSQTAFDFNSALWTELSSSEVSDVETNLFDFALSPNPVEKNKLNIEIVDIPVGEYIIEICDIQGNLIKVKKYKLSKDKGRTRIKIKVGDYKSGTYFVKMRSGINVVEKKFKKI